MLSQPHDRASVVLGRVQLPAAIPVMYARGRLQAAIHLAGRVAADMTVLQNHMSKADRWV